jgi:hypothetical protein
MCNPLFSNQSKTKNDRNISELFLGS